MAVSNWYSQDVIVYAVEDGQVLHRLGSYDQSDNSDGRLRFDDPYKMLFSPHDDRNLIIADSASNRVVEMNVDGTLVRFLEEIVPSDGNVYGLTANRSVIIVGGAGPGAAGNQVGWISVFDFVSGTLLRRFSGDDTTLEDFGDPVGVRITPDGKHIVVVEDSRDRLSLFTLAGEFVRRMEGHNYPKDVLFTSNGDMLVAEMSGSVVSLSSSDGSSAVEEVSYTSFSSPTALAFHGKVLFVLDADGPLVCLFV